MHLVNSLQHSNAHNEKDIGLFENLQYLFAQNGFDIYFASSGAFNFVVKL